MTISIFNKVVILSSLALATLLSFPIQVFGHASARVFQQFVGENIAIANFNVDEFHAGVEADFDVRLYTIMGGQPVPFETVDVRFFSPYGQEIFHQTLSRSQDINTTFKYAFPEEGNYRYTMIYKNKGDVLAEASFPVLVFPNIDSTAQNSANSMLYVIGAGIVSLLIGYYAGRLNLHQKVLGR